MKNVSRVLLAGLTGLVMLCTNSASAQQSLLNVSGWNAYVHLPSSYSANPSKSYPAIIFFPGLGEVGTSASKVIANGPGAYISQGWNGNVSVNGQTVEFIVVSLQTATAYPAASLIKSKIDELKSQYRIDANNVILTGLSHGGWCANMTAMAYPALFKTVVEIEGVQPGDAYPGMASYPSRFGNYATAGGRLLGFEQSQDWRDMLNRVNTMNNAVAGSGIYVQTNFGGGGHCCWNSFYGGQGVQPSKFTLNGISQNMYEWMARRVLGTGSTPSNTPPVANAGSDKIITLPTNSISLSGSGTDANGTVTSYSWSKVSGPAGGSIVNAGLASTSLTGLVQGVYVFQLKVTDNSGASATDNMQVTVNPLSVANAAPVANAGADKSITLPTNSIVITGTGTDIDGTISSYSWKKNAGGSALLTNANTKVLSVSNMVQGVYDFELTVTDNKGATAKDIVRVTINASSAPVPASGNKVNVNLSDGVNNYNNVQWNNWKPGSGSTSPAFKYSDGSLSTVKAVLSSNARFSDNGSAYGNGATAFPKEVIRIASMASIDRSLVISGLNPSKRYNLEFYASRAYNGCKTIFIIGAAKDTVNTDYNVSDYAKFNSMAPDSRGNITVSMKNIGTYQYLSGFSIAETTTAAKIPVSGNATNVPDADPETMDGIEMSLSPSKELQINSRLFSGTGILSIKDAGGRNVFIKKISVGPGTTFSVGLSTLKKGSYIVKFMSDAGASEEEILL